MFSKAFEDDIDTVFHIAAIVGPYHKVNYYVTQGLSRPLFTWFYCFIVFLHNSSFVFHDCNDCKEILYQ